MLPQNEIELNRFFIRFGLITIALMIIPFCAALKKWQYLDDRLRAFFIYFLVVVSVNIGEQCFVWTVTWFPDLFSPFLEYFKIGNVNFIQILYYLADFIFLARYYELVIGSEKGNYIKWIGAILSCLALVNYLFFEGYQVVGVFNSTADGFFVLIVAAYHLWRMNSEKTPLSLSKNPLFWISLSVLLPQLFMIFFNYLGDKIYATDFRLYVKLALLRSLLMICQQFFFAYAFWQAKFVRYLVTPSPAELR